MLDSKIDLTTIPKSQYGAWQTDGDCALVLIVEGSPYGVVSRLEKTRWSAGTFCDDSKGRGWRQLTEKFSTPREACIAVDAALARPTGQNYIPDIQTAASKVVALADALSAYHHSYEKVLSLLVACRALGVNNETIEAEINQSQWKWFAMRADFAARETNELKPVHPEPAHA